MDNQFFEKPILNSPYGYPLRHWELDASGQPTQQIVESRRRAEFITPIPKPKKRKGAAEQTSLLFDEGKGLTTEQQRYDHTAIINAVRQNVDQWRKIPSVNDWRVTPETARLLQHWRNHEFASLRPFFCQVEAVETAIWLTEVAPQLGKSGERFLEHLDNANNEANPGLMRMALKLATGAGKTTVMAMLIAWQTINAVRRPQSKRFPVVALPGVGQMPASGEDEVEQARLFYVAATRATHQLYITVSGDGGFGVKLGGGKAGGASDSLPRMRESRSMA